MINLNFIIKKKEEESKKQNISYSLVFVIKEPIKLKVHYYVHYFGHVENDH